MTSPSPAFDDLLDDLATGEAVPGDAADVIALHIVEGMEVRDAQRLYDKCTAFIFKALRSSRPESELAAWSDVFGRMAFAAAKAEPRLGHKFEVFIDLIHRSRAVALTVDREALASRKHVRTILLALLEAGGSASRQQLMKACALRSPNLSRVVSPLLDTGMLRRETLSREVIYSLSADGTKAAAKLAQGATHRPRTKAAARNARARVEAGSSVGVAPRAKLGINTGGKQRKNMVRETALRHRATVMKSIGGATTSPVETVICQGLPMPPRRHKLGDLEFDPLGMEVVRGVAETKKLQAETQNG